MKKIRNKKYNASKTTNQFYKSALKDKAVLFVTNGKGAHLVNLRNGRQYLPTTSTAHIIENLTTKWCILCAVILKDQSHSSYASYYVHYFNETRKQHQISEEADKVHQELLKSCNKTHLVNLGWIAVPHLYEFDEEQANSIFDQAGAWNDLAEWEIKHEQVKS